MMDFKRNFINFGYTNVFKINFDNELENLQKKIYNLTKKFIIDHNIEGSLEDKIKLQFKSIPKEKEWSYIMEEINQSKELEKIICSPKIQYVFKKIFEKPKKFIISTFRARFPSQKRSIYNWHQDEGTWFFSKNKDINYKYPATLWLSINGAKPDQSIQLLKSSHKYKLHNHEWVRGQGFFKIKNLPVNFSSKDIFNPGFNPSEAVIFHPLTMHRSSPNQINSLRPRYSIDIRYYNDINNKKKIPVNFSFKMKKFFRYKA